MKILSTLLSIVLFCSCNNQVKDSKESPATASSSTSSASIADKGGCSSFFWFKKGGVLEYDMSDGTGKYVRKTRTTIDEVHQEGAALVAEYSTTFGEDKKIESTYKCEGDKLYMNMKSLFDNSLGAMKLPGVELQVDDAMLSFPWDMKPGDKLDDATFQIKAKLNGKDFMTIKSTISDRLVEKMEEITTAAGTFKCMKLTEKHSTYTGPGGQQGGTTSVTRSIQWFNPNTGLIRSESYGEDDKLQFRSDLINVQ